ncbi:zinc finger, CCHC-type containing protein [Tanacetum coccineum]
MTLTGAWKKEIWLKGLLAESGYELSLVAGIATGALVKGSSRSEVPAQVEGAAYRQQNVRVTKINKVDMRTSFRPGDIVKAQDEIFQSNSEFADSLLDWTMRFKKLENKTFCMEYEDTNHNRHSISSDHDHDLEICIAESTANRTTVIRMMIVQVVGN